MRKRAGALNRAWLAVIGLVLLLAGAFWILTAAGLVSSWGLNGFDVGSQPLQGASDVLGQQWLPGAALAAGIVLVLLAVWWLAAQTPRKQEASPLQLHRDARQGTTVMPASAVTDALEQRVEDLEHVTRAKAVLRGTARAPELALDVTANERVDVQELLGAIQQEILPEAAQALEQRFTNLGVQVSVSRETAKRHQVVVA